METTEKKKYPHFKHFPFSLEVDGVKAEVSEEGKIRITQGDENEYDEINTSARFINKLQRMLYVNRTVSFKDEPFKPKK